MGDCLLGTPNYVRSSYFPATFGGGSWLNQGPLDNLKDKFFINQAISETAMAQDTQLHVHFAAERGVKMVVIPNSDVSKLGQVVVKASSAPAWTGVTIAATHSVGETQVTVNSTAGVSAGDVMTIAGDPTVYDITTIVSPTSLGVRNTTDRTGLLHGTTAGLAVTCHSGKYGGPEELYNSGYVSYYGVVYPPGILTWGSPGVWDGRETDENLSELDLPRPYIHVLPTAVSAAYWYVGISDESNPNGGVALDALIMAAGFSPRYNMTYGTVLGLKSNSTSEESAGGAEVFGEERSGRYVDFRLENASVEDGFVNLFDMQRRLDIYEDLFFIFDVDDTSLMTRRSFVGRFETLSELDFAAFDIVDIHFRIKEKIA